MSKHSLATFTGDKFTWDDDDPKPWSDERVLLDIYERVSGLHKLSTYTGKDPYERYNLLVSRISNTILDSILELRNES